MSSRQPPLPPPRPDLQPICCPREWQHEALCRALDLTHPGDVRTAATKILMQVDCGELSLDGLRVVLDGERLVASCWANVYPGRIAQLSPPWLEPGYPLEVCDRLLTASLDHVRNLDARLAQVSLPLDSAPQQEALSRVDFHHLAELAYLACDRAQFPQTLPESPLEFVPVASEHFEQLVEALQASYQDTLDCPGLAGLRSPEEVLDGYRQLCHGETADWYLVHHDQAIVGCLLLSSDLLGRQSELVYLGLVPAARGRGWGHALVRQAQWQARSAGMLTLSVAVDCANTPGVKIYERAGFAGWERRLAWIRQLRNPLRIGRSRIISRPSRRRAAPRSAAATRSGCHDRNRASARRGEFAIGIDPQQLADRGHEVDRADGPFLDEGRFGIGAADHLPARNPGSAHRQTPGLAVMVPSRLSVELGRAAELAHPDHQRAFQQTAGLEVVDQSRHSLIHWRCGLANAVARMGIDPVVLVPAIGIDLDQRHSLFDQASGHQAADACGMRSVRGAHFGRFLFGVEGRQLAAAHHPHGAADRRGVGFRRSRSLSRPRPMRFRAREQIDAVVELAGLERGVRVLDSVANAPHDQRLIARAEEPGVDPVSRAAVVLEHDVVGERKAVSTQGPRSDCP